MGFVDSLQLKGRIVDIYLANGMKLDAARVKEVSSSMIQVTHKNRIRYLNPDHIVVIEVG